MKLLLIKGFDKINVDISDVNVEIVSVRYNGVLYVADEGYGFCYKSEIPEWE